MIDKRPHLDTLDGVEKGGVPALTLVLTIQSTEDERNILIREMRPANIALGDHRRGTRNQLVVIKELRGELNQRWMRSVVANQFDHTLRIVAMVAIFSKRGLLRVSWKL